MNRVFIEAGGRLHPGTKRRLMPTPHPLQGHNLTVMIELFKHPVRRNIIVSRTITLFLTKILDTFCARFDLKKTFST